MDPGDEMNEQLSNLLAQILQQQEGHGDDGSLRQRQQQPPGSLMPWFTAHAGIEPLNALLMSYPEAVSREAFANNIHAQQLELELAAASLSQHQLGLNLASINPALASEAVVQALANNPPQVRAGFETDLLHVSETFQTESSARIIKYVLTRFKACSLKISFHTYHYHTCSLDNPMTVSCFPAIKHFILQMLQMLNQRHT